MTPFTLLFGSLFGGLAVVFGAFGVHTLKKVLSDDQLKSFETGVKYQLFHALLLLILGFNLELNSTLETYMIYSFISGIILFSFSIYGLVISSAKNKKLTFLGPITPIGGLILIIGWSLLIVTVLKMR
ncbi:MAG: DUF423 domain-containing protein [Flavobacteriaceae bacterium]|nr:DUF423 domain-containing protein [Flavobacteriaceae bacterium]